MSAKSRRRNFSRVKGRECQRKAYSEKERKESAAEKFQRPRDFSDAEAAEALPLILPLTFSFSLRP